MKWLRLYHEILDDPKVQRLEPALFKFWINFLCLANQGTPRGTVKKGVGEIAFALRIPDDEAAAALAELERIGLIEAVETGLKPHNWDDRQRKSDDVTARVTAHRGAKRANETLPETLHETPPKQDGNDAPSRATELEGELEREENDTPPSPPAGGVSVGDGDAEPDEGESGDVVPDDPLTTLDSRFEAFWTAYPRKVGKDAARRVWERRKPDRELTERMLAAITQQRTSEDWTREHGRFIPNPATWLNQGRWQDEVPRTSPPVPPPPRSPALATASDQKAFADRFITQLREH